MLGIERAKTTPILDTHQRIASDSREVNARRSRSVLLFSLPHHPQLDFDIVQNGHATSRYPAVIITMAPCNTFELRSHAVLFSCYPIGATMQPGVEEKMPRSRPLGPPSPPPPGPLALASRSPSVPDRKQPFLATSQDGDTLRNADPAQGEPTLVIVKFKKCGSLPEDNAPAFVVATVPGRVSISPV